MSIFACLSAIVHHVLQLNIYTFHTENTWTLWIPKSCQRFSYRKSKNVPFRNESDANLNVIQFYVCANSIATTNVHNVEGFRCNLRHCATSVNNILHFIIQLKPVWTVNIEQHMSTESAAWNIWTAEKQQTCNYTLYTHTHIKHFMITRIVPVDPSSDFFYLIHLYVLL